jgi:hypothetical protein
MTSTVIDKFDRVDGPIGANWLIPCGNVTIFDESVYPVDSTIGSGPSPVLQGTTERRTQALQIGQTMDGPDQMIRAVYSHTPEIIGEINISQLCSEITTPPSFTVLVRMSKDPLLVDLGGNEEPSCYDQGYGLRITHPCDGSAPIMKLVKFMPSKLPPGINRPVSTEVDNAQVLAQVVLRYLDMHVDPEFDGTSLGTDRDATDVFPYRGFVQEIRLRIRLADDQVRLEAFINDRNLNTPILDYTDYQNPLWGEKGLPGFEFLSALASEQPAGTSPFSQQGVPLLVCHLFQADTVRSVRRPVAVHPSNFWTYSEVTKRVITLVEKNGDAKYNATVNGQTKLDTYLAFVLEAEKDILRREGYWQWLLRSQRIYLEADKDTYELPADLGMIEVLRPGNWNNSPLPELTLNEFRQRLGTASPGQGGKPLIFTQIETSVDSRQNIRVFPVPAQNTNITTDPAGEDPYLIVEYYARHGRPQDPDV